MTFLFKPGIFASNSAMSIVREREAGTLEQLLATPARPVERASDVGALVMPMLILIPNIGPLEHTTVEC